MLLRRPMSVILFLSFCGAAVAEEVPREKIEETIAVGVETILATQNDAGGFVLEPRRFGVYPLGCTGISVLALQHALPHLKGELRTQAAEGIRKGIAFIAQRPPEQKTYSAGFILCALYKESPQRYHKLIGKYAEMLVVSQWREKTDRYYGEWGYNLHPPGLRGSQQPPRRLPIWGDRSNDQIAILGLYYAERAGYQIPKAIWRRAREHYQKLQIPAGGWGYKDTRRPQPYANMTIASTISLFICEEMLYAEKHRQFKPPARSEAIEKGLAWIVKHWDESNVGQDVYGAYALERLGIIRGRSNIGTHDWFNEAAAVIVGRRTWRSLIGGNSGSDACFAVLFLARGLEPIVINKLERKSADDWNNNPYDVKHVIEYIVDHGSSRWMHRRRCCCACPSSSSADTRNWSSPTRRRPSSRPT